MAKRSGTQTITSTSDQQKSVPVVTVESFYNLHAEKLHMKLEGPQVGFHRKIREPTINRPGLALSGFFSYFAEKRVQVLGAAAGRGRREDSGLSYTDDHHEVYQRRHHRAGSRFFTDGHRVRKHGRYSWRRRFDSRSKRHRQKRMRTRFD